MRFSHFGLAVICLLSGAAVEKVNGKLCKHCATGVMCGLPNDQGAVVEGHCVRDCSNPICGKPQVICQTCDGECKELEKECEEPSDCCAGPFEGNPTDNVRTTCGTAGKCCLAESQVCDRASDCCPGLSCSSNRCRVKGQDDHCICPPVDEALIDEAEVGLKAVKEAMLAIFLRE